MKRLFLGFVILTSFLFVLPQCQKIQELKNKFLKSDQKADPFVETTKDAAPISEAAPVAEQVIPPTSDAGVLGRVNGEAITDAQVYDYVKDRLKKLESQIFEIKRGGLSELIEKKLVETEATKRGVSIDDLLKSEVTSKVEEPSQQDLETYYSVFKNRFKNQPLAEVKGVLIQQLKSTREKTLYDNFLAGLEKNSTVEVLMKRPRIEVSVDDDPSQGPKVAPITLIEFSDFQCPFCKRARETVSKIMETYKGKVHYVFRDFPLSFHKQAGKASEASQCAHDQGKYWEYNAKLWETQGQHEIDALKTMAKGLGLDTVKFNQCLDSGKFTAEVEKDAQDGVNVGVSGTPAYFINGIFLSGAQPFENFAQIIDEELREIEKK
ncbi:MAG: hypothetical protein A3G32_09100 [Deltaproteobacteria bacterium RIFCSPLOWO2_12_FULL_40_28]|nr:MAG: hypothetical protein A3C45_07955 [Deltaproteobacteria bacterium RIFCSPHIGHO2_02_FULL_40_28]OGQ21177.1 MAG: hypothetical protein A3E27_01590 [Deltaproteobacteria bacterium RIFCSPHIGHO2_12_FULL_40_32]OGQ39078.1 MAG: hypothetical protein A3I69_09225 [Deltaproteobacteria bacterium RIFCSPLOWO2_02_FULL_40_36]OGQ53151.1 MAG: hypothetical protein A3G32_09100 [Deltaproteobacteria bacterium RIFCSPLOWO2_12_FULL_40_28]